MATQSYRPRRVDGYRKFGVRLGRLLYDVEILHSERMPKTGAMIAVSNHVAFLDGPVVFVYAPRRLRFLVKRSYFSSAWGVLLKMTGQIPIDQNTADREALATARQVLADGGGIGIFPEGTRGSGAVQTAQQGAAFLAQATGAQIVPVAVFGTRGAGGKDSWPKLRGPLRLVVGEPFILTKRVGVPGRERLRIATEELRTKLAAHVAEAARETGLALHAGTPE
ncbi:lysophospholipid acyltransferase family protein [Flexivirga oryzae]|uniref:1-acyl-sn-glycerol-3-phosphate acyltransferase n=1 Tax=Flexivirga oryzae TaxID=1794944 RepID=A0A839N6U8_9MICO|nr:lysophospholipid acyltransferase family protein [Flexivirga oryzae]MBB2891754.1 1-acyl-sn-glycerol-3-phosphate acyltransferase [Flexivirga oryzae]